MGDVDILVSRGDSLATALFREVTQLHPLDVRAHRPKAQIQAWQWFQRKPPHCYGRRRLGTAVPGWPVGPYQIRANSN